MAKCFFIVLLCLPLFAFCQFSGNYQAAKDSLSQMMSGKVHSSFKKAVFITENTYFDNALSEREYLNAITLLSSLVKEVKNSIENPNYTKKDREYLETWFSIFKVFTDTVNILTQEGDIVNWMPFTYDFDDIFGKNKWSKMFVTKLMGTKKGNCHSLPYLYKIICDELNVPCHLALAPNHVYIKHKAEKGGWYNTELTSASFPIDAWLMASGYISLQAVQNGIYLDTLSEKESIALCVLDLAQGYNHKYPDNDGTFVIECCDLALKHFPDYVNAILLKAETRLKQLQAMQKEMKYAYLKEVTAMPIGKTKWDEMNSLYMQLYKLGYRQMPEQMYVEWLTSLKTEKEKYSNKNAPGATKD
jgi:hypothetical protein